jgi:hypothetical protein
MEFSLVLQGPLCDHTFKLIDNAMRCEKIKDIIVSHWNKDTLTGYMENYPSVKLVTADHLFHKKRHNPRNLANQAATSLAGLLQSKSEYSIKLRSDWLAYNKFDSIIEKFNEHPEKILTSNIFFRPSTYAEHHCSDHLIVSKTDILIRGFIRVLWMCDNKISIKCPENCITLALLYAKKYDITADIVLDMKSNFEIITIEDSTDDTDIEPYKRWRYLTSTYDEPKDPIISNINDYY